MVLLGQKHIFCGFFGMHLLVCLCWCHPKNSRSRSTYEIVTVISCRGARRDPFSAVSSSLTSIIASAGGSRFLVRCRIQRALVTACISSASRTFIFSRNFITNSYAMGGCCTGCSNLECQGAAIALPSTKQYSLQRFVRLIWECPEERVSLVSGNYVIAEGLRARHNCGAIPELIEQDHIYLLR